MISNITAHIGFRLSLRISDNASKRCFGGSVWDNQSDYSQCREQCLVDPFLTELEGNLTWDTWEDCYSPRHDRLVTDISEVIYYVGEFKEGNDWRVRFPEASIIMKLVRR